jgi:hypothetical protein
MNHQVLIRFQQNWLKQEVVKFALRSINLLILFGIKTNCLSSGRSQSLYLFIRKVIKQTSNYAAYHSLSTTYKVLSNILPSKLTPYAEEIIGDHQCGFSCNRSTIGHIFCVSLTHEKKWEQNKTVHQLFVDLKKACYSVRKEVSYYILIEFGIPLKLVRLIKMCQNETCSRVGVGKHLSDRFRIKNGLKQGDALSPLL